MSDVTAEVRGQFRGERIVASFSEGRPMLAVYEDEHNLVAYLGLSTPPEDVAAFARTILEVLDPDALAKAEPEIVDEPTPPAPVLANSAVIDPRAGTLTIDGNPFPFHLAEEGPTTASLSGALTVLSVPILIGTSVSIESSPAPEPVRFTLEDTNKPGTIVVLDSETNRVYPFVRSMVDAEQILVEFLTNPNRGSTYMSANRSEYGV